LILKTPVSTGVFLCANPVWALEADSQYSPETPVRIAKQAANHPANLTAPKFCDHTIFPRDHKCRFSSQKAATAAKWHLII
jgi:hypothetical protein